ncbi:MAG: GPW/gp25 family protein [Proteobacteria bacterium]|nr:GPW/gp25 family protein [Cystobacterineae bacterium]MCL2314768.1 GPW/gp25 family protein [Pseudomonadota bacterium]
MPKLPDPTFLKFPFHVGENGPEFSKRAAHVRSQIEQVLMTLPGERVFRPNFGIGVKQLVFEPNTSVLWDVTRNRLISALMEALRGEVDPSTLQAEVTGEGEKLNILVSYTLARIGLREEHVFSVSGGS